MFIIKSVHETIYRPLMVMAKLQAMFQDLLM